VAFVLKTVGNAVKFPGLSQSESDVQSMGFTTLKLSPRHRT
jgi:hypothetical protein